MPSKREGEAEKELRRVLEDLNDRFPKLKDDEVFVMWFLRAFLADSDDGAASALCGGPTDKGVDAVFIDDSARTAFVVQGKRREGLGVKTEGRNDLISFADLADSITGDIEAFGTLAGQLSPEVLGKLEKARQRVKRRRYGLRLFYVTTGKCSRKLVEEAQKKARHAGSGTVLEVFDGRALQLLLSDYLDGVAPPVPSLDLEIESGGGVKTSGIFNRYDSKTEIESWVFSMSDLAVAGLFERAGTRLFARNVRGFLGNTQINEGMEKTLSQEPSYFWYYNNGITIICDDASHEASHGRDVLHVTNPQVINGQQTTRTLFSSARKRARASVLVRVIRVPRKPPSDGDNRFEALVSKIVSATNWQNAIRPSDLMSNDRRQVELERELRKVNYLYLRKRMTKGEARRALGANHMYLIKKEELAQAVAGCDLEPVIVREGKERLFEEQWYSHVFPNADPNYYLPRYWLMRQVAYAAKGYPERAYAKWVALNFAWNELSKLCYKKATSVAFREACERSEHKVLRPIRQALGTLLIATLRFYRASRGVGPKAIDVSTFFKRHGLDTEFQKFWRSQRNRSRAKFRREWTRFGKALRERANT